jgi:hypothetical protein
VATPGLHAPALGEQPWLPLNADDVLLNTFNGRPTAGLVATEFGALLFWQFSGHGTGVGMWLYLPLSDDEAEYIVDHPAEPMLAGLTDRIVGRQGILALSWDGQIQVRGPYSFRSPKKSLPLVARLLRAMASGLRRSQPELPSGRHVEVVDESEEVKREAASLVEAALEGCPA